MAQVPMRQPRFLGEKVPYREQTMQEQIQSQLGSNYTVQKTETGYVAKAKPVKYLRKKDKRTKMIRRGEDMQYSHYIPHEMTISSEGKVLRETKRGTYTIDGSGKIKEWGVYDSEVTDYEKQTRFTYGKRDMKSGRDSIRQTSSYEQGRYREKRLIHQDSKEYEQKKAEADLFKTFVGQGRSYAEARRLSRMTEAQREAKFKAEARARTEMYSLQGKAVTMAHQRQRAFEQEYKASAQKYASDIAGKQHAKRQKEAVVQQPAPVQSSSPFIVAPTPASPTTRTDMSKGIILPPEPKGPGGTMEESRPFQFRTGHVVTTQEEYMRRQQYESDNIIQKQIDRLRWGYEDSAKDFPIKHPIAKDVVVPFAVGTTSMVLGVVAHPVEATKQMAGMVFDPPKAIGEMQTHFGQLTQTKGEVHATSYIGGQFTGGYLLGRAAGRGVELAKDVYVKTGSRYVAPERVFSEEVLTRGKTLPTTTSTAQSLGRFNMGGKTYDVAVAEQIVRSPETFARPPVKQPVRLSSPVLRDIQASVSPDSVVYTGGVARRVLTGKGRIRDVDVITETPRESAYAVAERYPERYEVIRHEKYPEIYRLRTRKGGHPQLEPGKVVADFDPVYLAEEGLINPKAITKVGEYRVVKPEVMLKSKAIQIVKGKTRGPKQGENIQQLSPDAPIFKEGVVVTTVSPAKIKGTTVTGKVEKVGLEDPGLYVTPKGEASPYFTGIEAGQTTYSLNPLKGIIGVPTATELTIRGVTTYPKSVVMKPGFAHLQAFQEAKAGQGMAFITKRSQIGTGDIPRQTFTLEKPTVMSGQTVKAGRRVEAGTSEIEAVIGVGEEFAYTPKTFFGKVKGFDTYTIYKGRAVAVREADLLLKTDAVPVESIVVSGKTVKAGQELFESLQTEGKIVTPAESIKAAPYGSIIPSARISTGTVSYLPPTVTRSPQISPGVSVKSSVSAPSVGVSGLSPGKSVASSFKSAKSSVKSLSESYSPSRTTSLVTGSSLIGLSGRSFGGSSGGGSSVGRGGSSGSGISRGGGSRGGSSGGSSRPSTTVPPDTPKYTSRRDSEKKKRKQEFEVQVREKGIFKTIARTESPERAFRLGKFRLEQTASASLRVKPVGSGEKVTGIGKGILPRSKFRLSTKEPDVFIQRRRFRISTPGEKREITYKGLQVLKHKSIFRRR